LTDRSLITSPAAGSVQRARGMNLLSRIPARRQNFSTCARRRERKSWTSFERCTSDLRLPRPDIYLFLYTHTRARAEDTNKRAEKESSSSKARGANWPAGEMKRNYCAQQPKRSRVRTAPRRLCMYVPKG
jgi:hypothetical protein